MKPKKCKNKDCRAEFTPARPLQSACSIACAISLTNASKERARAEKARKERLAHRQAKERIKTKAEWMREAQTEFNTFIRLRDKDQPCICCGSYGLDENWLTGGKWDAGHFLGRGAYPELRFIEDNVHKQLKTCNGGSGKFAAKARTVAQEYRDRLIMKIGIDRVEFLEGPHEPKRYTIDDLKAIKAHYRAKVRELKSQQKEDLS